MSPAAAKETSRAGPGSPAHIATAYFQTAIGARGAIAEGTGEAAKSRDREVAAISKAADIEAD
jgi:hypothetical protein